MLIIFQNRYMFITAINITVYFQNVICIYVNVINIHGYLFDF